MVNNQYPVQETKKISKTFLLTISALLTALSLVLPNFMPRLTLFPPIVTATLFSHVPLMLAMMIHPAAALCAYTGTTVAFFINPGGFTGIRAASHLPFVIYGLIVFRKDSNFNPVPMFLHGIILSLIHAASEALAAMVGVYAVAGFANNTSMSLPLLLFVAFLIYLAHSIFDFFFAQGLRSILKRSRLLR